MSDHEHNFNEEWLGLPAWQKFFCEGCGNTKKEVKLQQRIEALEGSQRRVTRILKEIQGYKKADLLANKEIIWDDDIVDEAIEEAELFQRETE